MNAKLDELLSTLEAIKTNQRYNKLVFYQPYPPQARFHMLGATKLERLLRAGNREGKTYCGAAEMSYHLTGRYPDWWEGKRFDHPIRAWACGDGAITVRDVQQKLLCGQPGVESAMGSGFIPRELFADKPSLGRGVTDAYDTIFIYHETNGVRDGVSTCIFKSYEQGRTKFQGDAVDVVWFDEEPDDYDIYSEARTRTIDTHGIIYTTYTPIKGRTTLTVRFMEMPSPDRADVVMTIYDAKHIPEAERQSIIDAWLPHEREARAMGQPMMGEGRVFPFPDDLVSEPAIILVPPHWGRLWSIDFGSGEDAHPFAATLLLWDKDVDCVHVHAAYKTGAPLVADHAAVLKQMAGNVRVAWPHDGNARERGAADETMTTAKLYKRAGLRMLDKHATFPDGGISTEAGIKEMYQRMMQGKFKVAEHLLRSDWGNEFRSYHRKDGLLVKVNDDLMSASRIGIMSLRYADQSPLGPSLFPGAAQTFRRREVDGIDFDVFQ